MAGRRAPGGGGSAPYRPPTVALSTRTAIVAASLSLLAAPARGELTNAEVRGHFNILAEAAYSVGLYPIKGLDVDKPCHAEGPFDTTLNFYDCLHSADSVELVLEGSNLKISYDDEFADSRKWTEYEESIKIDVPETPMYVYVQSCDKDECEPGQEVETQFIFVRSGDDVSAINSISLKYDDMPEDATFDSRVPMKPHFNGKEYKYELTIRQDQAFKIESTSVRGGSIGIEWIDWGGNLGQIWVDKMGGEYSSCRNKDEDPVCKRPGITCEEPEAAHEEQQQSLKKIFEGFITPRTAIISLCAIGTDRHKSSTNYTLEITVKTYYSSLLESITYTYENEKDGLEIKMYPSDSSARKEYEKNGGKFDPEVFDWEIMLPAPEDPDDRYAVDRDDPLILNAVAEENEEQFQAMISFCAQDDPRCDDSSSGKGEAKHEVIMYNNERRHRNRELPVWSRSFILNVSSADGEGQSIYIVTVKQDVSRVAFLSNLEGPEADDEGDDDEDGEDAPRPCVITQRRPEGSEEKPIEEFDPNVFEYECIWHWEEFPDFETAQFTPYVDTKKCPQCEIQVLVPKLLKEFDTLSLDYTNMGWDQDETMWRSDWTSGSTWEQTFLLGETHVIPIKVLAADRITMVTYKVKFAWMCPWYISAHFSRTVSTFVSVMAVVMALGSAGNIMALSKQIQFMILTTLVADAPRTYKQFAKSETLQIFAGEFDGLADIPPFCYFPTTDEVEKWFEHFFQLGNLPGDSVRELARYCFIAKEHDRLTANALTCYGFIDWDVLSEPEVEDAVAKMPSKYQVDLDFDDDEEDRIDDMLDKCEDHMDEIEDDDDDDRRLRRLRARARRLQVNSTPVLMPRGRALRRARRRLSSLRIPGNDTLTGAKVYRRRLEDGDILDVADDDDEDDDVYLWDDDKFDEFAGYAEEDGIEEDLFPDFTKLCAHPDVEALMPYIHAYISFMDIVDTLGGEAGTFIISTFLIVLGAVLYYFCVYRAFLKKTQKRYVATEPGSLILFVCNVLFIPYAMSCGKLMFVGMACDKVNDPDSDDCETDIQFYGVEFEDENLYQVWIISTIGLIAFPIAFVSMFTVYIVRRIRSKQLVYNSAFGRECWSDPTCIAAKVPQLSWLTQNVPIAPGIMDAYVRMCVPILTGDGGKLEVTDVTQSNDNENNNDNSNNNDNGDAVADGEPRTSHRLQDAAHHHHGASDAESDADSHNNNRNDERKHKKLANLQRERRRQEEKKKQELKLKADRDKAIQDVKELAELRGSDEEPPWMPDEDDHICIIGMYNLFRSWKSLKEHNENFKLDAEEAFAMKLFIQFLVREENLIHAYNIMKIEPQNGFLKPKEPCKDPQKWWLDSLQDYEEDSEEKYPDRAQADSEEGPAEEGNQPPETPGHQRAKEAVLFGHHPDLHEFGVGELPYVENSMGERLVWTGAIKGGWMSTMLRCWKKPSNYEVYGKMVWMKEPDEGWADWEKDKIKLATKTKEENEKAPMRYADKWQWITFEKWSQPWNIDEVSEMEWDFTMCGYTLFQYNPTEFVGEKFFGKVRKAYLKYYKDQVPFQIKPRDKIEIRKWVYCKLMHYMDMKMKLVYFADMHPQFTHQLTLDKIAQFDFHEALFRIYDAKPTADVGKDKKSSRRFREFRLIDYAVMKVEDTYEDGDEPWWQHCDPAGEEELKVMFDQKMYWKDQEDEDLKKQVQENDLIPEGGYHTSPYFMTVNDAVVGVKRYTLTKPDGSATDVKIDIELEHVPSLMTYVSNFKLSLEFDSLDLPERQNCEILVADMGNGEQFNFGVESGTLILAIVVLNMQAFIDMRFPRCDDGEDECEGMRLYTSGSLVCCTAFLVAKGLAFGFALYQAVGTEELEEEEETVEVLVSVKSNAELEFEDQEAKEDAEKAELARKEREAAMHKKKKHHKRASTGEQNETNEPVQDANEDTIEKKDEELEESEETLLGKILLAMREGELITLCLQTLLLLIIFIALFQTRREILGLVAIVIATVSMILVGLFATLPALKEFLEEQAKNLESTWDLIQGLRSHAGQVIEASHTLIAEQITMTVPDLGLTFKGGVEIDPELPMEQQSMARMRKKLVYLTAHKTKDDERPDDFPVSVHASSRFEDIKKSLSVAFTVQQMMLCQAIPQVVACLQCVNHVGSETVSDAKYDNYLTLFKPKGWQPEYDSQPKKVEEMHKGFEKQVDEWMRETLGAVDMDRTFYKQIKSQFFESLKTDSHTGTGRQLIKVRIKTIGLPSAGTFGKLKLENKFLYVTVVRELENMVPVEPKDFPLDRMTGYFRAKKKTEDDDVDGSDNWDHIKFLCHTPGAYIEQEHHHSEEQGAHHHHHHNGPYHKPADMTDEEWKERKTFFKEDCDIIVPVAADDVGPVRLMVWAQDMKGGNKAEDHLVGFTSPVDLHYLFEHYRLSAEQDEDVEHAGARKTMRLHCKWSAARSQLVPASGEDDEDADDPHQAAEQKDPRKSRRASFENLMPWKSSKNDQKDRGVILFEVLKPSKEQRERDSMFENHLNELVNGSGDSQLNLGKIRRFRDCWPEFAHTLGIRVGEAQLESMEAQLQDMRDLREELWDSSGSLKTKFKNKTARTRRFFEKGVRRSLYGENNLPDDLDAAIKKLENNIQMQRRRREAEKARLDIELSDHHERHDDTQSEVSMESADRASGKQEKAPLLTTQTPSSHHLASGRDLVSGLRDALDRSSHIVQLTPVATYDLSARVLGKARVDVAKYNTEPEKAFENEMVDQVRKLQEQLRDASAQILHYVMLSDHIKPNKNWRPDTISPHVAAILTNEIEDVPALVVQGFPRHEDQAKFERQQDAGGRPQLVHGRLCFRCDELYWPRTEQGKIEYDSKTSYLYWSGKKCWIISERLGSQLPKVLREDDDRNFLWLQDNAMTPDQAHPEAFWHKARSKLRRKSASRTPWDQDDKIHVTKSSTWGSRRKSSERSLGSLVKGPATPAPGTATPGTPMPMGQMSGISTESGRGENPIATLCKEVTKLLNLRSHASSLNPELKDCLVSLTPKSLSISWKDNRMEALAPFRKYLFERDEFQGYHKAWEFLTFEMVVARNTCVANLERMFEEIPLDIEKQEEQERRDHEARVMAKKSAMMKREGSMMSQTASIMDQTRSMGQTMTDSRQPTVGQHSAEALGRQSTVTHESTMGRRESHGSIMSASAGVGTMSAGVHTHTMDNEDGHEEMIVWDKNVLEEFWHAHKDDFGVLADSIIRELDVSGGGDAEGDGNLSIHEVNAVWHATQHTKEAADAGATSLHVQQTDGFLVGESIAIESVEGDQQYRRILEINGNVFKLDEPLTADVPEHALVKFETRHHQPLLREFRELLRYHPFYQHVEDFWAKLTEGECLTEDMFVKAVASEQRMYFMQDFLASMGEDKHISEKECADQAKVLFKLLDAQNNDSVTLNELKPSTGDHFHDIDRSLLKFSIPLAHISEVRTHGNRRVGADHKQTIRINIKPQFEQYDEDFHDGQGSSTLEHRLGWAALRRALDPDWEPVHNREYIEVCMMENFFELWKTVIQDSGMVRPQEWVSHYDGEFMDHPHLSGSYMRCKFGNQRWSNGQFYTGQWHNHVYSGHGQLFNRFEDYSHGQVAIYDGHWERGKKHGHGTLRFQQHLIVGKHDEEEEEAFSKTTSPDGRVDKNRVSAKKKGISKVYVGQFHDDLFHGKGHLKLEKATATARPDKHSSGGGNKGIGVYPSYTVDPNRILEFKGEFESNFVDSYLWVKERDPEWNVENEEFVDFDATKGYAIGSSSMTATRASRGSGRRSSKDSIDPEATRRKFDWSGVSGLRSRSSKKSSSITAAKDKDDIEDDPFVMELRKKAEECKDLELENLTKQSKQEKWVRWVNFFSYDPSDEVQKSGPALPDLALKVYAYRGGDCEHFKHGQALYADGTRYTGDFLHGRPHGEGMLDHKPIRYQGGWRFGEWHGQGTLHHDDGYKYEGQFENRARSGHGRQENKLSLVPMYGYTVYDGQWEDDQRHGKGSMVFSTSMEQEDADPNEFLYEGQFEEGVREGMCQMYFLLSSDKFDCIVDSLKQESRIMTDPTKLFGGKSKATSGATWKSSGTGVGSIETGASMDPTPKSTKSTAKGMKALLGGASGPSKMDQLMEAAKFDMYNDRYYKILYYSGQFQSDRISAAQNMAWLHLVNPQQDIIVGQYYYGQLSEDGQRDGLGTLFSDEASLDPSFMECVKECRPYTKERLICENCSEMFPGMRVCDHAGLQSASSKQGDHLKFTIYQGQWKHNLPHGEGVQFFPEVGANGCGGVYDGEFRKGRRHGRGCWQLRDKSFKYYPVPNKRGTFNWRDDMMHGIAFVEDSKFVHENVVYANNETVMPFAGIGPPTTNFEQVRGVKVVFKKVRHAAHTSKKREIEKAAPLMSMADPRAKRKDSSSIVGAIGSALVEGEGAQERSLWDKGDTAIMQKAAVHAGQLKAHHFALDEEDHNALIREPTEVNETEEDILVTGGKGVNAAMNGMYFKQVQSFGHSIWRMVKQDHGFWKYVHERYLYKDDKGPLWYIGPRSMAGPQHGPGCAQVEDENAEGPAAVRTQWTVWNPQKGMMTDPKEADKSALDRLEVRSIIGFGLSEPAGETDLNHRLLLRCSLEFYSRPVYETQDGKLFLYWFKTGGSAEEGQIPQDNGDAGEADPKKYFVPGHWVVAMKLGAGPVGDPERRSPNILAFTEDQAMTPYGIQPEKIWQAKSIDDEEFKPMPELKLLLQEWQRKNPMMDFFSSDGEDSDDPEDKVDDDDEDDDEDEDGEGSESSADDR